MEDGEEDVENIVFLWKTLIQLKEYILSYLLSSDQRLPQKHNGFSVFLSVFHKNTYKIIVSFLIFHKNICKTYVLVAAINKRNYSA